MHIFGFLYPRNTIWIQTERIITISTGEFWTKIHVNITYFLILMKKLWKAEPSLNLTFFHLRFGVGQ